MPFDLAPFIQIKKVPTQRESSKMAHYSFNLTRIPYKNECSNIHIALYNHF